jgi:hypothetical protein
VVDKNAFEVVGAILQKHAPHTMEQYPHVIERLNWLWSSPEDCRIYLQKILLNESGTRNGFPTEVMGELLAINHIFERAHPMTIVPCDAWALLDSRHTRGFSQPARMRATTTVYVVPTPRGPQVSFSLKK